MKKLLPAIALAIVLFSCKNDPDSGKFTVKGELKSSGSKSIILEELFFSQAAPQILDSVKINNEKFIVSAIAREEGLYRLRVDNGTDSYLFINEDENINFSAANPEITGYSFSGPANSSLKNIMRYVDSIGRLIAGKDKVINALQKAGTSETDSTFLILSNDLKNLNDNFTSYCFAVADTAKSPVVSLFAVTMAPVELSKFEGPLAKLTKRFPDHKGIAGALKYVKDQSLTQMQNQTTAQAPPVIGSPAPEITMNDVNDKPFSLSQLRGKYVLVDFWASWCGPCRGENPNVVAAYNQFKDKNFTVLGVSLDNNKDAWKNAIAEDKLSWQQISDLKKWSSAAVPLYGIEGIPYNVLVDPQGKIIANNLRGSALHDKLAEVLK